VTRRFEAVIFDMDGTLVEPLLDFQAIRRELAIPADCGILEGIEAMEAPRAQQAQRQLLDHETRAAREVRLMPGARRTLDALKERKYKTAMLTRNAREAMRIVMERFNLEFDLAWSRENGPIKPEPDGIVRACRQLGAAESQTACVGDFRYDIVAANDAGAVSILLARGPRPDFAAEADFVITELTELLDVLEN
jgi:HAD superfamily hydrolase (TIGR01509 family)